MRKLPILMLAMMLLLTACSEATKRGDALGREFMKAWGDTVAMRQVVQRFNALRDDSLTWPWEIKAANRAFTEPLLADGRDSLFQAANVIVLSPTELAQRKCQTMIEVLMRQEDEPDSAADHLSLIHWLCYTFGYDRHVEVFDSTLQATVDKLSLHEQMRVYAQASRPAALGAALADDANKPDADMADINARIAELRGIYSPEDFTTFEKAYQAALKKE